MRHFAAFQYCHLIPTLQSIVLECILYGLSDSQIVKLQRVHHTCAKLICNLPRFSNVTPLLRELHWLRILQRIEFKIMMIVYKALDGKAPSYIIELLKFKFHKVP